MSPGGEILGYKLFLRNANTAESVLVFDGQSVGLPNQNYFTVDGLDAGTDYLFSVLAVSYNYDGELSSE